MSLELSWTDTCFLLVLIIAIISTLNGLRKQPVRDSFKHILQKPLAASALVVLMFFLSVGVLDSLHINVKDASGLKNSSSSLLDRILAPLDTQYEKTYSAPFASTLYSLETRSVNGQYQQDYPKLTYTSQNFINPLVKWQWVRHVIVVSVAISVLSVFLICGIIAMVRQHIGYKRPMLLNVCGWSVLFTSVLCISFTLSSYWLSRHLHLLGTGQIGEDIFYYAVKSIRTGLVIGVLTTLFMMPLALIFGISSGYFGGIWDDIVQYLYTTLSSIPGVLLITASVLSLQTYITNHPHKFTTLAQMADARLLALCLILGVTSWSGLCRLLRAETLKLREIDYILAAKALGSRSFKILCKHILPNVMHIVVITIVLDFSFLVLAEAVLSYVGVGVSPMTISWGNMINAARLELSRDPIVWWPMLAAFLFMFMLVLASNVVADAVRDAFDPHRR